MRLDYLSLSSVILIESSTGSPVHVLMLSTQAVHGLPRLRAPGLVPCIISFSRHLSCFLNIFDDHGKAKYAISHEHYRRGAHFLDLGHEPVGG